jgi:TRAP transporter TAXI family solute receptor
MRHSIYIWIAAGLAFIALAALGALLYERPTVLSVAVTQGSDDQAILAAAAQKFAHDREAIRLKLVPVDSVAAAAQSMEQGNADLAVVRTDVAMPSNGQSVLIMRKNFVVLIAPAGSKLHSVSDLKGRRLGVLRNFPVAGTKGRPGLLATLAAQYDVPLASIKIVPLALDEIQSAVAQNGVDAILAVGVPDSGPLAKIVTAVTEARHKPPVFIPISVAKAISERSPFYESDEVVRGLFGGVPPRPSSDFDTLTVDTRLVARNTLKDETVSALTKLLLSVRPLLALRLPVANQIAAPSTTRGSALPVHPGAEAYIDDEEESFFDKYSDAIYIGALCLSALGSAAAALASRLGQRRSSEDDFLLTRLIAIVKASRDADAETLESLRKEADDLAPEALRAQSDSQRIYALGIAFEHARDTLKARQQALSAPPRTPFEPRIVPANGEAQSKAPKPT